MTTPEAGPAPGSTVVITGAAGGIYHQSLADPAKVARLVVDQALARRFWTVPSLDPYGDAVRGRIAELLEAEPTGQL